MNFGCEPVAKLAALACWMSVTAAVGKDLTLEWPTGMFDCYLDQLGNGSLPSQGWRLNVAEHCKPLERCITETARDETHGTVQVHVKIK